MLYSGVHIDELVCLRTDAISEYDYGLGLSFRGADGEDRHYPLISEAAAEAVGTYLAATKRRSDEQGALFLKTPSAFLGRRPLGPPQVFGIVHLLMRLARVEESRITPYALRNSFAKEFLDSGRDIDELQRILRIRSERSMIIYICDLRSIFINDEEDCR
jgi:site-specific recombinase XerD